VFPRSAKSIPLSDEARPARPRQGGGDARRGDERDPESAGGLLWFGGIGTYIRASTETDEEVGDRANDAIRITGAECAPR
jgi:glutamate dehydrogenase